MIDKFYNVMINEMLKFIIIFSISYLKTFEINNTDKNFISIKYKIYIYIYIK